CLDVPAQALFREVSISAEPRSARRQVCAPLRTNKDPCDFLASRDFQDRASSHRASLFREAPFPCLGLSTGGVATAPKPVEHRLFLDDRSRITEFALQSRREVS